VVLCNGKRVDASPSLALSLQLVLQASKTNGIAAAFVMRNLRTLVTVRASSAFTI
jgi:hypothetical protein